MLLLKLLQRICGLRRRPMTSDRATEILRANTLYYEVTGRPPIKEWKRNYAAK